MSAGHVMGKTVMSDRNEATRRAKRQVMASPAMAETGGQLAPVKRLLRAPEAAEFLGVRPATLADWRLRGRGPKFRRLGRVVAYAVEDLNAWIDEQPAFRSTAAAHEAARARRGAA
jgi:predicted DNA-binding transcriptional regulator AlpA